MKTKIKTLDWDRQEEKEISVPAAIEREISNYSITPRTFESRTLIKIDLNKKISDYLTKLEAREKKLEELLDKFKMKLIIEELKQLGISDKIFSTLEDELLKGNIKKFEDQIEFKKTLIVNLIDQLKNLKSNINISEEIFFKDQYQYLNKLDFREGPIVHRFGINLACMKDDYVSRIFASNAHNISSAASVTSKSSTNSKNIILQHPLELLLLEYSIIYLKDNPNSKTVLLDIIARDKDGEIKTINGTKTPEMHTIILCKTSQANKYLVIDPNKVSHSSHIAKQIYYYDKDLVIEIPIIPDIYTGKKDNIGPRLDQFRDCIDISVKIALGLQKDGSLINSASILTDSEILQMVSNNPSIDKAASKIFQDQPLRIKQSSNIESVKKFHELEIIMDQLIKSMNELCSQQVHDSFKDKYNKILSNNYTDKDKVVDLIQLSHDIKDAINQAIDDQCTLIGNHEFI